MPFLASPTLCEQIYRDGKDHIIAGSGQPVGTAERVPGRMEGYRRMAVCQRVPERRVDRGHLRDDGGRFSHRRLERTRPDDPQLSHAGRTLGDPGYLAHLRPQGHRQPPCRVDRTCWFPTRTFSGFRSEPRSRLIPSSPGSPRFSCWRMPPTPWGSPRAPSWTSLNWRGRRQTTVHGNHAGGDRALQGGPGTA